MDGVGNASGEMDNRIIDVPIESLPFIDEHYVEIAAKPDEVWEALMRVVSGMGESRRGALGSKALGCEDKEMEGAPGEIGSKIPGFVVTRSIKPAVLALMGQHRFSQYALIFTVIEKPSGLMLLSAQTRAVFPGRKGRLYRGLVIGSHGHVIVTTSLLRQVRRRAERIHARPARA